MGTCRAMRHGEAAADSKRVTTNPSNQMFIAANLLPEFEQWVAARTSAFSRDRTELHRARYLCAAPSSNRLHQACAARSDITCPELIQASETLVGCQP